MSSEDQVIRYLEHHGGEARMRVMMTELATSRKCAWPNSFNATHRLEKEGIVQLTTVRAKELTKYPNRRDGIQTNTFTVVRLIVPKRENHEQEE